LAPRNEFARPVVIDPLPDAGVAVELCADAGERRALARRFGLLELDALRATGRLERGGDSHEILFRAWLEAELAQACVVSLEPVPASIRQAVERRYRRIDPTAAGSGALAAEDSTVWVIGEDDEESEVDIVSGRTIDLGEAIAEELALALDPYPRAAAAADLVAEDLGPHISFGEAEPAETPFAALRQLTEKRAR
jgi:uncharacterized metal-binding protein YceD (DUF177 family)